jgi:hypothetical protein
MRALRSDRRYRSGMRSTGSAVLGAIAILVVITAGCGSGPGPTGSPSGGVGPSPSTAMPDASEAPRPSAVTGDPLGGRWTAAPFQLDDAHVAIASDACAAKARTDLGETDANLPTAVVDARGEGFVTLIMADDLNAIECLVRFDATGTNATVDSVAGLSTTTLDPVDGATIGVSSVVRDSDRPGGRTVAFGRIGPAPAAARIGLPDGSAVVASIAEGWWAAWWPGAVLAKAYAAVDDHDVVVGHVDAPAGEVEARVGLASWWLDPAAAAPTATSTTVHAIVREQSCASRKTPEGRVEPPAIDLTDTTVTITIMIRRRPGAQDCQGNPPFPVTITLPEPLGNRTVFDGAGTPPRNANSMPAA